MGWGQGAVHKFASKADSDAELIGRGFGVPHPGARTPRAGADTIRRRRWGAVTGPARCGGMSHPESPSSSLPHHKLIAYQVALELVQLVARIRIGDAQLRQQARKSAASAALNTAEGAARQSRADKSRSYAIALAEACEACAAVEIAAALGACSEADEQAVTALAVRLKNMLSRLVR